MGQTTGHRLLTRGLLAVGCALVWFLFGPSFLRLFAIPEQPKRVPDFFQEWAAGRLWMDGRSIYEPLPPLVDEYMPEDCRPESHDSLRVNVHPPTALPVIFPFLGLGYAHAFLAWNVLSVALFVGTLFVLFRQLDLRLSAIHWFVLATLLIICHPLRAQLQHGQLTLVLVALLVGAWWADRTGHAALAGTLVGTATAWKIFPGLVFVYFLGRRNWTAIGSGVVALLAWTGLTLSLVGVETFRTYLTDILPFADSGRGTGYNLSLPGLFAKLFDPLGQHLEPLVRSPEVARWGGLLAVVGIAIVVALVAYRARTVGDGDVAFAVAMTALPLASPVAWDHYLLFLCLPAAVMWSRLPPRSPRRILILACLLVCWLAPAAFYPFNSPDGSPLAVLTRLSVHLYAMVVLLGLALSLPSERTALVDRAAGSP